MKHFYTKEDFSLFINEENTYKYENNMKKKYHKTPSEELSKEQSEYFTQVYTFLEVVKIESTDLYNQTIAFIKYPYQSVVNDFTIVNITKDMSLSSFLAFISRIKYYHHMKCYSKDNNKKICCHFDKFIEKITSALT